MTWCPLKLLLWVYCKWPCEPVGCTNSQASFVAAQGLGCWLHAQLSCYSQPYFFFFPGANASMTGIWGGISVFLPEVCGSRGGVQGQQEHFELKWISPPIWCHPPWCHSLRWSRWGDHNETQAAKLSEPLFCFPNESLLLFFFSLSFESSREFSLKHCIKDIHHFLRMLLYFEAWHCIILLFVEEKIQRIMILIVST